MIHDLKDYKESLTITKHLVIVLKIINLAIKGLYPYRLYKPVQRILFSLEAEKRILEGHYEKNKKTKEEKGSKTV